MSRSVVETILGGVVLVVAVGFFGWAYGRSNVSSSGGYEVTAQFERADGLNVGSDVRISGIAVGKVVAEDLDPATYRARVRFTVRDGIELPTDSSAAIVSSGLLGGKYLSLVPGGDDRMLKDGDQITLTQSSVNLEDLIGKYIFGSAGQAKPTAGEPAGGAAPANATP